MKTQINAGLSSDWGHVCLQQTLVCWSPQRVCFFARLRFAHALRRPSFFFVLCSRFRSFPVKGKGGGALAWLVDGADG
jgi:hypothetical protein